MDQQIETRDLPKPKGVQGLLERWKSTHFKERGLSVETVVVKKDSQLHKTGFPIGTSVGIMHFKPEGKARPKRNRLSQTLLFGIEGFQRLFDQIDQNKFNRPDYLYGSTGEQMARQAEILGFRMRKANFFGISDSEDSLGISGGTYEVVAETDLVRSKLEELLQRQSPKGKPLIDVLRERSNTQPSSSILSRALKAFRKNRA